WQWLGTADHLQGGTVQRGTAGATDQLMAENLAARIDHEAHLDYAFLAAPPSIVGVTLVAVQVTEQAALPARLSLGSLGIGRELRRRFGRTGLLARLGRRRFHRRCRGGLGFWLWLAWQRLGLGGLG